MALTLSTCRSCEKMVIGYGIDLSGDFFILRTKKIVSISPKLQMWVFGGER